MACDQHTSNNVQLAALCKKFQKYLALVPANFCSIEFQIKNTSNFQINKVHKGMVRQSSLIAFFQYIDI